MTRSLTVRGKIRIHDKRKRKKYRFRQAVIYIKSRYIRELEEFDGKDVFVTISTVEPSAVSTVEQEISTVEQSTVENVSTAERPTIEKIVREPKIYKPEDFCISIRDKEIRKLLKEKMEYFRMSKMPCELYYLKKGVIGVAYIKNRCSPIVIPENGETFWLSTILRRTLWHEEDGRIIVAIKDLGAKIKILDLEKRKFHEF